MKIFITGIAGFLGSHLADEMLRLGHEVVGIDNMIGGDRRNVPNNIRWWPVDCNSPDKYADMMEGVDIVYHCAATAYEGLSVFSPHFVTENIVGASTGVFSAAIQAKVKRIVYCSSMARYGALVPPFKEHMECRPQDPYGIGKLCAEQMLKNLCETHGVEWVVAVPHNIIGPRQKYDDPFRNVASIMINRMLQGKAPIIYGDGNQKRCFSYIDDVLSCLVMLGLERDVVGNVFNIGPDEGEVTINELYYVIRDQLGLNIGHQPIYMPGRPQEVRVALCSSNKARLRLGYKTTTTLDVGIGDMIEFIKARGPKRFEYHIDLEIVNEKTPKTWTDRLI